MLNSIGYASLSDFLHLPGYAGISEHKEIGHGSVAKIPSVIV